jgi:hypothetical protein
MKLWPQKEFTIKTRLTPDEVKERLMKITRQVRVQEISAYRVFDKTQQDFEGEIGDDSFVIARIYYSNISNHPNPVIASLYTYGVFSANDKGSVVNITIKFDTSFLKTLGVCWAISIGFILISFLGSMGNGGKESFLIFGIMILLLPTINAQLIYKKWPKKIRAMIEGVLS